ncbi:MAG: DUF1854 domain-containing protein [bacterium]|nr:DUF1854 domain-containing protein [bacterium]
MKILNPDELNFEQGENGFLRLKLTDEKVFELVECTPLFPLTQIDEYISVSTRNDNGSEEIGIIKNLRDLPSDQQRLVKDEIQFRYFSPDIIDIKKITSKYGVNEWQVVTDKGDKTFFVQDVKENVIIRESGLIVITDIDKCRFQIRDYRTLPSKARLELEQTLL